MKAGTPFGTRPRVGASIGTLQPPEFFNDVAARRAFRSARAASSRRKSPTARRGKTTARLANPVKASAAELQLVPANVSIGVAKTALFPSISLSRAFDLQSTDLRDRFKGSAMTSRRQSTP
jgi:outer membrane protein TolC